MKKILDRETVTAERKRESSIFRINLEFTRDAPSVVITCHRTVDTLLDGVLLGSVHASALEASVADMDTAQITLPDGAGTNLRALIDGLVAQASIRETPRANENKLPGFEDIG